MGAQVEKAYQRIYRGGTVCCPLKVLERRTMQVQGEQVPQVLIKWQEGGSEAANLGGCGNHEGPIPRFSP